MNPMLQRHCAKYIYIVPDGLRELMSDISREVIRSQPEQIYSFIADYLDALMITRENARIAAKLVESVTEIAEITVTLLVENGLTRKEADEIVAVIQAHFRAYLARKRIKPNEEEEVEGEMGEEQIFTQKILDELELDREKLEGTTRVIQGAWHKFKERQEREKQMLFGIVDWRIAARSAIRLYRKTGVSPWEANRAATLIKAAYKGYYTRRVMRKLLAQGMEIEEVTIEEIEAYESSTKLSEETYPTTMYTMTSGEEGESESEDGEQEASEEDETQAIYGAVPEGEQTVQTEIETLPADVEQYRTMEDADELEFMEEEEIKEIRKIGEGETMQEITEEEMPVSVLESEPPTLTEDTEATTVVTE